MKLSIAPTEPQREQRYPYPTVTIEHPSDDPGITTIIELVASLLSAYGYDRQTITDAFEQHQP